MAFLTAILMLYQALYPTIIFASSKSPHSPEFSNFEPVGAVNMVDPFTGDFKYNLPILEVPGPNGSGYPLSLSYHNTGPEQEASWVGYGWTLNPGAVNRNKRGFPDDWKGEPVTYYNKMKTNYTLTLIPGGGMELFSFSSGALKSDVNLSYRYNTYKGHSLGIGLGLGSKYLGTAALNMDFPSGKGSFDFDANTSYLFSKLKKDKNPTLENFLVKSGMKTQGVNVKNFASGYAYGLFGDDHKNIDVTPITGHTFSFKVSVQGDPWPLPAGLESGFRGIFTYQKNEYEKRNLNVYGYMYSASAGANDMMDYYLEKQTAFVKRDQYLAIPFSNADDYIVTGEGLGGSFRLFNKKPGHFRPNSSVSTLTSEKVDIEIEAGGTTMVGISRGGGYSTSEVKGYWTDSDENENYQFFGEGQADEAYFFRFKNDPGGNIRFSENDELVQSLINSKEPVVQASQVDQEMNDGNRSGRSSYIAYHTFGELAEVENGVYYKGYTKNTITADHIDRISIGLPDQVGEFAITNKAGNRYVYGLPVYARNEANLQLGLNQYYEEENCTVENKYLAYINKTLDFENIGNIEEITGEVAKTPYATSYLLTEITSPNYIDRTLDGPTNDDFGGWTRFNYNMEYGSPGGISKAMGNNWYRWRSPYKGLLFKRNNVSDTRDDVGYFTSGEKEMYYLESIETKTHIAVFTTSERSDGLEAPPNNNAHKNTYSFTPKKLQQLDKIELHAKNTDGTLDKLIKTIHFEYDNSLMTGQFNAVGSTGKLTLKRIWVEYEGIINEKINPYIFDYKYPTDAEANYPAKYDALENYGNYTSIDQNPPYDPFNVDRWGNYQFDGANRFDIMNPWVNQQPDMNRFDPAAWQLKRIVLPTGGEIHVQYEQDDYLYVQEKRAMAMVTINRQDGNTYYLNTNEIGVNTEDDKRKLLEHLRYRFLDQKERIYFKFLFALHTNAPDLNNCTSEFIDGYVKLDDVEYDAESNEFYVTVHDETLAYSTPKDVCLNYIENNKVGFLGNANCKFTADPLELTEDVVGSIMSIITGWGEVLADLVTLEDIKDPTTVNFCREIDNTNSYFRIPVLHGKKGGDLRVKRLLMYDKGLEANDASLFGSEFIYEIVTGVTSGVATNEPSKGREENVLIKYLNKREAQNFINKIISGADKEQFEGPLGETILPGASVGYSTVITKNIYNGKTSPGYTINEYYTAKEFYFDRYTENTLIQRDKEYLPLMLIYYNELIDKLWVTQGYRFIHTNMHGQPKGIKTFDKLVDGALTSSTTYTYFSPGDKIPMFYGINNIRDEQPGKEMEVVFETRFIKDDNVNIFLEADVGVIWSFIPIPGLTICPVPDIAIEDKLLATHVTSKVISYPAIIQKIETVRNGISQTVENIGFDPATGDPVLTKTYDEYDKLQLVSSTSPIPVNHNGTYQNVQFPAHQQYPSMGGKFQNERAKLPTAIGITIDKITEAGTHYLQFNSDGTTDVCSELGKLNPGDLIEVKKGFLDVYYVDEIIGTSVKILPVSWEGPLTDDVAVDVAVVQSGFTNQLSGKTGNIISYNDENTFITTPIDINVLNERKVFADALNDALSLAQRGPADFKFPINYLGKQELRVNGVCTLIYELTYPIVIIKRIDAQENSSDAQEIVSYELYTEYQDILQIDWSCLEKLGSYGHFDVDPETGQLIYIQDDAPCNPITINCLGFCPDYYQTISLDNLIGTGIVEFTDIWGIEDVTINLDYYGLSKPDNPYETGEKGKWRPKNNFVYKTGTKGVITSNDPVYDNLDVFDDFTLYNWKYPAANDAIKWLETSAVTKFSPDGTPLEEKDLFDIYSTIKYGYDHSVPYLVADNAAYKDVMFEGFEKDYPQRIMPSLRFEDDFNVILPKSNPYEIKEGIAHSGERSLKIPYYLTAVLITHEGTLSLKPFELTNQMNEKGLSVKFWLKEEKGITGMLIGRWFAKVQIGLPTLINCNKVAKTGEWTLYEAKITDWGSMAIGDLFTPKLIFQNLNPIGDLLVDDIRVQPMDAQMTTYVYDVKTLKILTSFDDQHFGLYYQYNAEGKLVRQLIETENGMKTIQETQYNIPKLVDRP